MVRDLDKDITGEIPTPNMDVISKMISNAKEKGVSHIVGVSYLLKYDNL